MPGVPDSNPFLGDWGRSIQLMRAIASQQQATITDNRGRAVYNTGLLPGTNPARYGIQFLDPSTGNALSEFSSGPSTAASFRFFASDGSTVLSEMDANGMHFYDASGNELVRLDATGLHIYSSGGTEEVAAGLLSSSPPLYGLGVLPYGGSELQMVGGSLTVTAPAASSVTSNGTWTDFGSPSSIICEIGPSGQAAISVTSYLGTYGGNESGSVGVAIDGTNAGTWAELSVAATGGVSGIVGSTITLAPGTLTAGSHTFQLQYQTGPNPETFSTTVMTVQPL